MLEITFWALLILCAYSYFLYPLTLIALTRFKQSPLAAPFEPNPAPSMSLIVTAHNEAHRIREKIENSLALTYNDAALEIIIASDCSEDGTDDIVQEYQAQGVKLVRATDRLGKEHAQLCAIKEAQGEVIVFSDVATQIPTDALSILSNYFSNPKIGSVSSEDRFINQSGDIAGEGAYVKYEMWLRKQESKLAGLVGLSGSFFAVRKDLCQTWDIHSPSDFNTALNTASQGHIAVSAPDVLGYYQDLSDPAKEYARKTRTIIRGLTALSRNKSALNPFKNGLFAFQVISHKLMRWLEPWLLIALLITSIAANKLGGIYSLALTAQIAFYLAALVAHYHQPFRNLAPIKLIYFFVQVNMAIFDASCQFLAGKRMTVWQPSIR